MPVVLIDRTEKTLSRYSSNMYRQIYNLDKPEKYNVTDKIISSLIRRTQSENYHKNSKATDGFIYEYLMSDEERAKCKYQPRILASEKIIETDDYGEAVTTMCEWFFVSRFKGGTGNRDEYYGRMMAECKKHISVKEAATEIKEYTFTFNEIIRGNITIKSAHEPTEEEVIEAIMSGEAYYHNTEYENICLAESDKNLNNPSHDDR